MPTIVYKYGVPARIRDYQPGQRRAIGSGVRSIPVELPDALLRQLRLAHDLRNDLVTAWQNWQKAKLDLWSAYPQVAEIEGQLDTAEAELEDAVEAVRQQNQVARSRQRQRTDADRNLTAVKKKIRDLKAERKAAIADVYETHPDIVVSLSEILADYHAAIKALKQRYTDFTNSDYLAALRMAKQAYPDTASPEYKAAIKAVKAQYPDTSNPDRLGLYWATFNAVLKKHNTAVNKVSSDRVAGKPAALRHKRWDGSGFVAVQLQREHGPQCRCAKCAKRLTAELQRETGKSCDDCRDVKKTCTVHVVAVDHSTQPVDPPRSPELLASGSGKWASTLQITPYVPPDGGKTLGRFRFALDNGEYVELPVVISRPLPANADICEAQLVVRKAPGQTRGQDHRMFIAVTVEIPDEPVPTAGHSVAVHVGWRVQPDGAVRIATWATDQPITVPEHLSKVVNRVISQTRQLMTGEDPLRVSTVVVATSPTTGEIHIPALWISAAGRPAAIRGHRDTSLDAFREQLASWLDANPQPEPAEGQPPAITGADVRRWRSPRRFVALRYRWQQTPPTGDGVEQLLTDFTAWYERDFHLWAFEANERSQLVGRRDDFFRQAAAWLATGARRIIVDNANLAALRRKPASVDEGSMHPIAEDKARAKAQLVAPGETRAAFVSAAARRSIPVLQLLAESRRCPACQEVASADPRYAESAVVECPNCGHSYDQDHSVVAAMLRASGEAVSAAS